MSNLDPQKRNFLSLILDYCAPISDESATEESEVDSSADSSDSEEMSVDDQDILLDANTDSSNQDFVPSRVKLQESSSSGEDTPPPTRRKGRRRGRGREGSGDGSSSQPGMAATPAGERCNDIDTPDIKPPQPTFRPRRAPRPKLNLTASSTPQQLFRDTSDQDSEEEWVLSRVELQESSSSGGDTPLPPCRNGRRQGRGSGDGSSSQPGRAPGPKLNLTASYTPQEFFRDTSDQDSEEEWVPDTSSASKRSRVELQESGSSGEDTPPPTRQKGRRRGRGRVGSGDGSSSQPGRGREGRSDGSRCSSGQLWMPANPAGERWNDVDTPDIMPPQPTFRPSHAPGPKLNLTASFTPLELFRLFFTDLMLDKVIQNTNIHGSTHYSSAAHPWSDITLQDMFSFMALIIYMGLVKCSGFSDYWRGGNLYSFPFPKRVMSGRKFLLITRALHLSSPEVDDANEQKKGTAAYDNLCKIKPFYNELREACRRNYHPDQEISIDERMVRSKSRNGLKQYMKNKPVKWGFKLYVLADSKNGYTWDFFVYEGRSHQNTGMGLGYESVMELMDTRLLGTGYKLYVDQFYTSPVLFRDLLQKKIWACGTIRSNRIGLLMTKDNSLDSKSPSGSIRWMRMDSLLFIQWRDRRDVFMCSTLHTAHSGNTVHRRVRGTNVQWTVKDIPVPPCVKDYNRCMGGVDLSDALISYYKVLRKTRKWYKTFFFHFMDIAIVNAFLLHKAIATGKGEKPLSQKAFRETLVKQLAKGGCTASAVRPPSLSRTHHKPVYITGHSTDGRLKCRQCHAKTPLKCTTCDVPLCFVAKRECYNIWHVAKNL